MLGWEMSSNVDSCDSFISNSLEKKIVCFTEIIIVIINYSAFQCNVQGNCDGFWTCKIVSVIISTSLVS